VTDDQLEAALRTLGTRLDVPAPPDMVDDVLARLDEPVEAPRWGPVHRIAAAVVAALLVLATAMAVSPTVRAAVYDLFRIGGVEIHENEKPPVTPSVSVDPPLAGQRDVTLAEARREADFPLRLPTTLDPPVTVRLIEGARVVSMAFGSAHGQVRVDQFDGGLDPMFTKFTNADDMHRVFVQGVPGVWVDRPHPVFYTDETGRMREETARLSGSSLIWEKDGITYRVEGDLTQAQAVDIAESLR
jgi:hypothetical protein